jgi:AI-2 transport protein TqsA
MFRNRTDESQIQTLCLLLLTGIALTHALAWARAVCVPLVLALIVFSVFWPLIRFLRDRLGINKWLATFAAVLTVSLVSFLVGLITVASLRGFVRGADAYQDRITALVEQAKAVALGFGVDLDHIDPALMSNLPVFSWARDVSGNLIGLLGDTTLVMVFVLFMIVGAGSTEVKSSLLRDIQNVISRFLIAKIILNLVTSLIMGIVFVALGVELAALFIMLTFFLLFIPGLGAIVAMLLPLPVVFLTHGLDLTFWLVAGLGAFVHLVLNNIAESKVMGDAVRLHPIVILASLIFWGLVWGFAGMFLAVPLTAAAKIILARLPATRRLADWLEGRI